MCIPAAMGRLRASQGRNIKHRAFWKRCEAPQVCEHWKQTVLRNRDLFQAPSSSGIPRPAHTHLSTPAPAGLDSASRAAKTEGSVPSPDVTRGSPRTWPCGIATSSSTPRAHAGKGLGFPKSLWAPPRQRPCPSSVTGGLGSFGSKSGGLGLVCLHAQAKPKGGFLFVQGRADPPVTSTPPRGPCTTAEPAVQPQLPGRCSPAVV